MKTFETPKVVELGTLTQIVLSDPVNLIRQDAGIPNHGSNGTAGS